MFDGMRSSQQCAQSNAASQLKMGCGTAKRLLLNPLVHGLHTVRLVP